MLLVLTIMQTIAYFTLSIYFLEHNIKVENSFKLLSFRNKVENLKEKSCDKGDGHFN